MILALIVAAVLLAVLWAAVFVVELPVWLALVPTVLVTLGFVALVAVRRIRARRAAQAIEQALSAQAEAHARNVRPDMQPEIQEMQAEFSKAVNALKASRLGRGGRDSLSVLPWYMIIGPPASGKSTALRNSGLQFPYLSARGGGVKGVGGTRNCEWWLTNEAVILDTAGRYTTEDDDRDEWFSFLDTLARTRPRKPINGIMVAVSVGDLLGADEDAAAELGQKIRERVDEVMARLKLIVPVYLLFTKCDLMAGFVETFGDLHKNERGQIWGFTVPVGAANTAPEAVFSERFSELCEVLQARLLRSLSQERRLEGREKILQFPHQFESLRGNLGEFIRTLFAQNVYQDTPVMRGVYFTSGTQEGRPIDRIMQAMAKSFGIRPSVTAAEPVVDARSYFLRDLFSNVIFPDRNLAALSTTETDRRALLRYVYAGSALAFALLVLLFPTVSFFKNRALVRSTHAMVAELKTDGAAAATPASLERLNPLRARMDELYQHQVEGPPASMRLGMYPGDSLFVPVRNFYGSAVRRMIVDPILSQDAAELEAFARKFEGNAALPSRTEQVRAYDRLKLHLLLTGPKGPGEPALGEAEQAWVVQYATARWRRNSTLTGNKAALEQLAAHLDVFARLLAADPSLAAPRNEHVVATTRATLGRLPITNLALEQIIESPGLDEYALSLGSMLGVATSALRSDHTIPGAFTRKGYEAIVKARLAGDAGAENAWVLGRKRDAAEPDQVAARLLQSQYFERYLTEWKTFLASIRMPPPVASTEALAMLEDLTRGEPPPLGKLFRAVAFNVRLADDDHDEALSEAADGVLGKLKKKVGGAPGKWVAAAATHALQEEDSAETYLTARDVERAFAGLVQFGVPPRRKGADPAKPDPVPLDVYQEQLVFLRDALRNDLDNPEDHGPLLTRLQTARVRIATLIDQQEIGWRPRLTALLTSPLEGASSASTAEAASGANMKWCSEVVSPFERSLAGRYPFSRNGHDAALADVAEFYRPGQGTLWAFYASSLQTDMLRRGDQFVFARRLGNVAGTIYKPQVLTFLSRANDISSALFTSGSSELGTQFSINIRPSPGVATISFTVDGQHYEYRNGPEEWQAMKWPGGGKKLGASLKVRNNKGVTETIEQEGEWGLFRLLEAGKVQPNSSGRVFTVVWKIQSLDAEVAIDFRPSRSETPFFGSVRRGDKLQLLRPFRLASAVPPRSIGKSGAGCATQ